MVDGWVVKGLVLPVWAVGHVVGSETLHISKSELPGLRNVQTDVFGAKISSFQKLSNLGADLDQCVRSMKDPIYIYNFEKQ